MERSLRTLLALLIGLLVASGCGKKEASRTEGGAPGQDTNATEEPASESATAEGLAGEQPEAGPAWFAYEEGLAKAKTEGKILLIDFWTGWCHWCKVMDKETYAHETVITRLGQHFVCVKVNAESDEAQGGPGAASGRALAREYGVSSYPTTWFVDAEGAKIAPLGGFVPPDRFTLILDFISSGAYKTQDFQAYQQSHAQS
jgi:thioredoxin-related protein